MLSGKLIHLIEEHWDEITRRVIDQIRREPEMKHYQALPTAELNDWGRAILRNLDHWMVAGNERELAEKYEDLGRMRFIQHVPLHESVRALCLLRKTMIEFVEEHYFAHNTLEFCTEEELERRLGYFFDLLVYHLVRGYEQALRLAAHVEAA